MPSKATAYNSVKIGDFNCLDPNILGDALKGMWQRRWEAVIKLTIVRSHAILSSVIVNEETVVKMDLPTHEPFYLEILSESGSRNVLITDGINMTLNSGEQCRAVFTISEVQNGRS